MKITIYKGHIMPTPQQIQQLTIEYFRSLDLAEDFLNPDELGSARYRDMLRDVVQDLALRQHINIATATPEQLQALMQEYIGIIRAPIRGAIWVVAEEDVMERFTNLTLLRTNDPNAALGPEDLRVLNEAPFRQQIINNRVGTALPMFLDRSRDFARAHFTTIREQPSSPPKLRGPQ
jgi:hypothetical protein